MSSWSSNLSRLCWSPARPGVPKVLPGLLLLPSLLALVLVGPVACNDLSGLAGQQQLPAGTPNPSIYRTAAGALALYQTTLAAVQFTNGNSNASIGGTTSATQNGAFVDYALTAGLLTDELQSGAFLGCQPFGGPRSCTGGLDSLDARQLNGAGTVVTLYNELQGVRNDAALGIGALSAYAPDSSPALRGHLYALRGYAELLLADLYCSGVPLSTMVFHGTTTFTYAPGSATMDVYRAARAQFDTAITLSGDSARILNLARVGQGRALLALGQFDQAAQAVANVPDGFQYQFPVDWSYSGVVGCGNLFHSCDGLNIYTVADHEGVIGLPYRSGGDPRTAAQTDGTNNYGDSVYVPLKYGGSPPAIAEFTVADWIEARLIRAEAFLQAGNVTGMLAQLNDLRQNATVHGQTGSLAQITADPGTGLPPQDADTARVNLLFRERAYWLFLTGHRQGDLRRLRRAPYGTSGSSVYPFGVYPNVSLQNYGTSVDAPIPAAELANPKFHGCLARGA